MIYVALTAANTEINCNENLSNVIASGGHNNGRHLDDNGNWRSEFLDHFLVRCNDVHLCPQKSVNYEEHINIALNNLVTSSYQTIRGTDSILKSFWDLVSNLPRSFRSFLRIWTSVQYQQWYLIASRIENQSIKIYRTLVVYLWFWYVELVYCCRWTFDLKGL